MAIRNFETAIILAGGKSVRMGENKVLIALAGETLVDRAVRELAPFFEELIIAANDRSLEVKGAEIVFDEIPHLGPMGGIIAGLRATKSEYAFVRAVDMPFLDSSLLEVMDNEFESGYDVIICETERGLEPLSAVYSKCVLEHFSAAVERRETSLVNLMNELRVKTVPYERLVEKRVSDMNFFNVNRPQDMDRAKKLIADRSQEERAENIDKC